MKQSSFQKERHSLIIGRPTEAHWKTRSGQTLHPLILKSNSTLEPLLWNCSPNLCQVETHSFEDISPLCPPLPGKAIKLFFFFFRLHPSSASEIWLGTGAQRLRFTITNTKANNPESICIEKSPVKGSACFILPALTFPGHLFRDDLYDLCCCALKSRPLSS